MVEGLDAEDEVKLLRLRTRKNELVIVPGMCTIIVGILVAAFVKDRLFRLTTDEVCWVRFQISACRHSRHATSMKTCAPP